MCTVCLLNLLLHFIHCPTGVLTNRHVCLWQGVSLPANQILRNVPLPHWGLTLLSRLSQGGGVFVHSNGVANFESCNIYDNYAGRRCNGAGGAG